MPDMSRYNEVQQARRSTWAEDSPMTVALEDAGNKTPCRGKDRLFDAAHGSFVARWAARMICDTCPLSGEFGECLKTGQAGEETGVWGGFYSNDGFRWEQVRPAKQSDVLRALLQAVDGLHGVAMVKAVERIAPGMRELFLDEHGKLRYKATREQCILRTSRRTTLPNGEVGSIREYIMVDLLGVESEGGVVVHTTCSNAECVAPWHLRYVRAPHGASRSLALGLYAAIVKEWKLSQVSEISGITPAELRRYVTIAEAFGVAGKVPGTALQAMTETYTQVAGHAPTNQEMAALIRFCAAADDLDCDTVAELLSVGESEF